MSDKHRSFRIQNGSPHRLAIHLEPEAVACALAPSDEVVVHETYRDEPLTMRISAPHASEIVLTIWPGDGNVRVEKGGRDILDVPQALSHTERDLPGN